jgi:replication initiation and membrane attachment protein DnaB
MSGLNIRQNSTIVYNVLINFVLMKFDYAVNKCFNAWNIIDIS